MPMGMSGHVAREGFGPVMGMHPFGWIFQLLILFSVGLVIYWVVCGNKTESAMDIVRKRLARGEISKEEFLKMKKVLK